MKKSFRRLYNNYKAYMIKFLIGVMGALFVVHVLYKIKTGIWWLESEWSAGDLLTFIGTMLLGAITVKLSIDSNEMNDRLVEIENKRALIEKEDRLGHVVPRQVNVLFLNRIYDGDTSRLQWSSTMNETTERIQFQIKMDVTAHSIIHKVKNTKSVITRLGDLDGPYREYMLFYERESEHACSIDLMNHHFVDYVNLDIKKDNQFHDMKFAIVNELVYRLQLEYVYENTLDEHRKVIVSIVMRGKTMTERGLISVE